MDRPTGVPQFQQNRFDSATTGLVISAESGSISGTRGISTSPPPSRRVGDSARVIVVEWSSGSVSAVPTDMPSESSKCGRNTAWVAIGRIVDIESMSRSSRLAGWVPGLEFFLGSWLSDISPSTSGRGAPAAGRAPLTICGTTCSTCRRGGCGPACR